MKWRTEHNHHVPEIAKVDGPPNEVGVSREQEEKP